jgi:hypothetical protein
VHPPETRAEVLRLIAAGLKDGAVSRELGVPRSTVRDIRNPRRVDRERCWRCWKPSRPVRFTPGEYAELLGLYLGDGHITIQARTQRLRLSLDSRHVAIVRETVDLLARGLPRNRVEVLSRDHGATSVVYVYSSHLCCLLPQHGAGRKHARPIVLEDWQEALVDEAPWSFLRGLVHSDGCFFNNRTGPYRYLSVAFDNRSADIRRLFAKACDRVGVTCRPSGTSVRIYGRSDVAEFAAFVGAKR